MNLYDLTSLLDDKFSKTAPVFYHHAVVQDGEELPVPYIVTNSEEIAPFRADNSNYFSFVQNTVTLYTDRFDPEMMGEVEKVFNDNCIPFERSTDFDEEQMLFFTEYDVQLDELSDPEPENGTVVYEDTVVVTDEPSGGGFVPAPDPVITPIEGGDGDGEQ